jgi:hypothetical protein
LYGQNTTIMQLAVRKQRLRMLAGEDLDAAIEEARSLLAELDATRLPQAESPVADIRSELGYFLVEADRAGEAIESLRQAMEFYRRVARQPHPILAANGIAGMARAG